MCQKKHRGKVDRQRTRKRPAEAEPSLPAEAESSARAENPVQAESLAELTQENPEALDASSTVQVLVPATAATRPALVSSELSSVPDGALTPDCERTTPACQPECELGEEAADNALPTPRPPATPACQPERELGEEAVDNALPALLQPLTPLSFPRRPPPANPTDEGTPTRSRAANQQETPCPKGKSALVLASPWSDPDGPEVTFLDHPDFGIFKGVPSPPEVCTLDCTLQSIMGSRPYELWRHNQEF